MPVTSVRESQRAVLDLARSPSHSSFPAVWQSPEDLRRQSGRHCKLQCLTYCRRSNAHPGYPKRTFGVLTRGLRASR